MANNLIIGDLTPETVFQTLTKQGLSESQAASFVGSWLLTTYGILQRHFDYHEVVADTDPNAVAKFVRSFVHQDWTDGTSMVQASETPGELGFNTRFHRIEKDFDALAADVATAFLSLASLRKQMKNVLDEIKTELNRIDADIANLQGPRTFPFTQATPNLQGGVFLGQAEFSGKKVQIWQTAQGMMMMPDLQRVEMAAFTNSRSRRAGQLQRYLVDNPAVRQAFPQAVTKQAFVQRFGNDRIDDGTLVRDVLASLPDDAQYANIDAMAQDVIDREATALRTTPGAPEAIASSLGIDAHGDITKASVDHIDALPPATRQALLRAGIGTMSDLAKLTPAQAVEIATKEREAGITAGELAHASGVARTLVKLAQ
jgi:hypothetical protein